MFRHLATSRRTLLASKFILGLATFAGLSRVAFADSPTLDRVGALRMSSQASGSILVDHYRAMLESGEVDRFCRDVSSRYTDATLARLLAGGPVEAKRASVVALGLMGDYRASNPSVARALKDEDPTVRALAHDALWAIWFRADSPENNEALEKIRLLNGRRRFAEAIDQASRLIERAPDFAEAYNQRAIAHFSLGNPLESSEDCRKVLDRNPYHFGALGGLGQCQLQLGKAKDAVETFRRAAQLQPHDDGLKELIQAIEDGL